MIETKAGAAGAVGAQVAASAKPDGYTLLVHIVSISGFAEVDKLFGRTPKFTRADFIPIARFVADPMVLVVNDQLPYKTLKELVDDAKANSEQDHLQLVRPLRRLHIPTALFVKAAGGLQMRHLPTNGGGPALTAVLGNNAQFFMSPTSIALSQIKAGKLRPLAVSGAARAKALPDVPTFKERGLRPRVLFLGRPVRAQGHARAGRSRRCATAVDKAAHSDQFKTALANLGQELAYLDQPEFAKFWAADAKRIEDAVHPIGSVQG